MGICVGLQVLFTGSAEAPSAPGLDIIPGSLVRFDDSEKSVPHIGWNGAFLQIGNGGENGEGMVRRSFYGLRPASKYYYVHSYAVPYREGVLEGEGWNVATAIYGGERFVGAIGKGNFLATQFHPEKSGVAGLRILRAFLEGQVWSEIPVSDVAGLAESGLTRRVIACLDVRANDAGDLVVTKGDQYDVREKDTTTQQSTGKQGGEVRNLGKPVDMARSYYDQGADEITFLNITSFRNSPLADLPMLEILRQTSETVFVPLTIGGGIKDTTDPSTGLTVSALEIAKLYFDSGADKVSIGTEAVLAAEQYLQLNHQATGTSAIEQISAAYGKQAVVISIDPKRIYTHHPSTHPYTTIRTQTPGPNGEPHCWYQCTIRGGREARDIDVQQMLAAAQALGAGEILLNCIDRDGSASGFDLELIDLAKSSCTIPVIASSGAGVPGHFVDVFQRTRADAALGAGMVSCFFLYFLSSFLSRFLPVCVYVCCC